MAEADARSGAAATDGKDLAERSSRPVGCVAHRTRAMRRSCVVGSGDGAVAGEPRAHRCCVGRFYVGRWIAAAPVFAAPVARALRPGGCHAGRRVRWMPDRDAPSAGRDSARRREEVSRAVPWQPSCDRVEPPCVGDPADHQGPAVVGAARPVGPGSRIRAAGLPALAEETGAPHGRVPVESYP